MCSYVCQQAVPAGRAGAGDVGVFGYLNTPNQPLTSKHIALPFGGGACSL